MSRVLVVGAGVVGLSCAVRLAEAGDEVAVLARDLPAETCSAAAPALCYFSGTSEWAARTTVEFERLAGVPGTGVTMRWGTDIRHGTSSRAAAPVADTSKYLPWLTNRLTELGGTVTRQALSALPNTAPVVVHCSGLAARRLASDQTVRPVRGQVCVLDQVGLTEWWLDRSDPDHPCAVVPRDNDIVVGGTVEPGDWNRLPDTDTAERILRTATRLVPALAGARVRGHRVGLRPDRPTARLETETLGRTRIVHCYGHGDAGYALSWGCADEVVRLTRPTG